MKCRVEKKQGHTPGPWKVSLLDRRGQFHVHRNVGDGTNRTLVSTDEALANARLIRTSHRIGAGIT